MSYEIDVAVIGGGPAGISAATEISKNTSLKVAIFDSENEIGGMPRSCHLFFGMRDKKSLLTGKKYAAKLREELKRTSTKINVNSTVLRIDTDDDGLHKIVVANEKGLEEYQCKYIVLATGCFEISRQARLIPGTRPSGVYTTGSLQQIVNLNKMKPGKKAVILGSEIVSLSAAVTLKRADVKIQGMLEEDELIQTYSSLAKMLSIYYKFPIYTNTVVKNIFGKGRVEGIEVFNKEKNKDEIIKCDTVIVTGKFRPDASLLNETQIERDENSLGPVIDSDYMTSIPNIYAVGNVLRGANMHDICALEGVAVARNIVRAEKQKDKKAEGYIYINAQFPIRFFTPQRININSIKSNLNSIGADFSMQVDKTMKQATIEAWVDDQKIWNKSYPKLIANHRIKIPVESFVWNKVGDNREVNLIIKD